MKNVLALDLSTKASGYAVSIDGELKDHGVIKSSSTNVYKRILIMRNEINELIKKYNVTEVVMEEVPGGATGNSHTQKVLLNLQGVIATSAFELNNKIIIDFLQSSEWRSNIGIHTGRGIKRAELKEKDIAWANAHYNLALDNDDEADALCLLAAYGNKKVSVW